MSFSTATSRTKGEPHVINALAKLVKLPAVVGFLAEGLHDEDVETIMGNVDFNVECVQVASRQVCTSRRLGQRSTLSLF